MYNDIHMKEIHYSRHTHAINKPIYYILLALDDRLSIIIPYADEDQRPLQNHAIPRTLMQSAPAKHVICVTPNLQTILGKHMICVTPGFESIPAKYVICVTPNLQNILDKHIICVTPGFESIPAKHVICVTPKLKSILVKQKQPGAIRSSQ